MNVVGIAFSGDSSLVVFKSLVYYFAHNTPKPCGTGKSKANKLVFIVFNVGSKCIIMLKRTDSEPKTKKKLSGSSHTNVFKIKVT